MKKTLLLSMALCLTVLSAFAQFNPQERLEMDPRVRTGKLENGLTYYVMHNDRPAQRADFYIVTNVGAIQETPDQDGLAHFLEHMCLNGTRHFPGKGIISYMESIGCAFGRNINASTGTEQTQYMLNNVPVIREGIIDSSLLILYDYSAFVTLDPKEMDAERGVILEEKRTRDTYEWRQYSALREAVFKDSKMANTTVIGTEENLKTFKPQSLVNFYKTWYRPDLQAIIVVGDIDVDAVEGKIRKLFGTLPKAVDPQAKVPCTVPDNDRPIVSLFKDKELNVTGINVIFKRPKFPKELLGTGYELVNNIGESFIGAILNERFSEISTKPASPFYGASAGFQGLSNEVYAFVGSVQTPQGQILPGYRALMAELERARRYGFTQDEFDRAKTNFTRGFEMARDNAGSRMNSDLVPQLVDHFGLGSSYLDPAYACEKAKAIMDLLSVDMINELMKNAYGDKNIVLTYYAPDKEGLAVPTEAELVNVLEEAEGLELEAPKASVSNKPLMDASGLQGSKVVKEEAGRFGTTVWTLKNGMQIILKPTDFIKDQIMFTTVAQGGMSILPTEILPSFQSDVFGVYQNTCGLADFSQMELGKMLTGKSVGVAPYISSRDHGVTIGSSIKDFETGLQMMYLYYTQPRFNEQDFNVGFDRIKAIVPNVLDQPDFIYQDEMNRILTQDSPRRPRMGRELLEKVSLENIEKGYRLLMADQAGLKVFITGSFDKEQIRPLIEKYVGSLPVLTRKGTHWVDEKVRMPEGRIEKTLEAGMETPKTTVSIIYSGKLRKSFENDIRMSVLNSVMEQLYTKTIREEEGGTYGVNVMAESYAEPEEAFMLGIMFETDPAKAGKLMGMAKEGLEGIAQNGPDPVYVKKAKENLLKGFPELLTSNKYWHNLIYKYYTLGRDSHTGFAETVNRVVTPESIQSLARELISQGNVIDLVMNPKGK